MSERFVGASPNKGKWKTETIEYKDENEDFKNKFVSSKMTLYKFWLKTSQARLISKDQNWIFNSFSQFFD